MATIDQRILIPTTPGVVWDYISDISKNPVWQVDCETITFLTSRRAGPGTRWRTSAKKGHDEVIEIKAWYDGLGYEYNIIDGNPFQDMVGRIRLQEIAEGTVVQWTVSYETGGFLGGVRNSLSVSRQIESTMAASLKALWKEVNSSGAAQKAREAKSLMRDAPDAEARAQYKPRHPSVVDIRAGTGETVDKGEPVAIVFDEPPVTDEDTRPRVPVTGAEPAAVEELVPNQPEDPEFLQGMERFAPPAPPVDTLSDTQPIRPVTVDVQPSLASEQAGEAESIATSEAAEYDFEADEPVGKISEASESADALFDELLEDEAQPAKEAELQSPPDTPAEPEPRDDIAPVQTNTVSESVPTEDDADAAVPVETSTDAATYAQPAPPTQVLPEPAPDPTGEKSIWEIFGVPRPDEIADIVIDTPVAEGAFQGAENAPVGVTLDAEDVVVQPAPDIPQSPALPSSAARGGLRLRLRLKRARLRLRS